MYLERLAEHPLVACKTCRCTVWPDHVRSHLKGRSHGLSHNEATVVADEVRQWTHVTQHAAGLEVPLCVERAIPQLPVYTDGLLCQSDPSRCRYICRRAHDMARHYRQAHQRPRYSKRGRPSRAAQEAQTGQVGWAPWRAVQC